jgi:hypothetical protein
VRAVVPFFLRVIPTSLEPDIMRRHRAQERLVAICDKYFPVGVAMLLLFAGCSRKKNVPETVTVTGTVLLNGNTVEGAEVSFQPKSTGPDSHPARGTTDASGKFTLKTYIGPGTDVDGAIPGDYLVSVTKVESNSMTSQDMAKMTTSGKKIVPPKNLLPARYANPQKSKLTATVSADGSNDFKFELKN